MRSRWVWGAIITFIGVIFIFVGDAGGEFVGLVLAVLGLLILVNKSEDKIEKIKYEKKKEEKKFKKHEKE